MLMNDLAERRKTTRLTIETDVTLSDQENNIFKAKIQNLSSLGALIQTDEQFKTDNFFKISIYLQGDHSNLIIDDLSATVVRHDTDSVAVKFIDTMEWLTLFYVYRNKLTLNQA